MLANYFTTAAASIGGNHVSKLKEDDLNIIKALRVLERTLTVPVLPLKSSAWKKYSMQLKISIPESHVGGIEVYPQNS